MTNVTLVPHGALTVTPTATSSADDFDFLIGRWVIQNRKLKARLSNSHEWDTFEATGTLRKVLHGRGNIDDFITAFDGKPFEGMALRIFDPATKLWSIYWSDTHRGTLDKPVVGSFDGDIGRFYCRDTYEGKDIVVMFQWDKTDLAKPVWSQAFSADNGRTWEWNWYMYFSRPAQQITFREPIRVLELRNYQMQPDMTQRFVQYFSDHFVGTQQAQGAMLPGIFTVQGEADRFFWMRGFGDMASRLSYLQNFYGGPVWKGYGREANSMMIDSDQVHLLRPWRDDGVGDAALGDGRYAFVVIDYYHAKEGKRDALLQALTNVYSAKMKEQGVLVSLWVTEMQTNDFPRLPVIQEKDLVVTISLFLKEGDYVEGALNQAEVEKYAIRKETVTLDRVLNR
ncbi:NIPSNAP family protein [Dawidia soli]|uniref:NIPSNAP family protein n=1 Tax=Dawidia soli TaxID=2782352 RepID=A0AAP2D990_9BACT|nr:NIPSNAP family protein [Dawidia soli]MBT1687768.1 NIPSNAP family protein [Dawidia soli]